MRCLKIIRHHWICSFVVSLGFLSLFAFGISPESYALNGICSIDFSFTSASTAQNTLLYFEYCSGFPRDKFIYFRPSSLSFDFTAPSSQTSSTYELVISFLNASMFNIRTGTFTSPYSFSYNFDYSNFSDLVFYNSSYRIQSDSSISRVGSTAFNIKATNTSTRGSGTISVIWSDDISYFIPSQECDVCPDVPDIPENPYDNKFDEVTKAIYVCGAVLIMLYFFFCIYKIIVKDGGSR